MASFSFSLTDLPNDPFELRGKLFAAGIEDRIEQSTTLIKEYANKELLYHCVSFMDYVFLDAFKGDVKKWNTHGGFPSAETTYQFDFAMKHALVGSYKAAMDNLRSCLELTLLSVYFALQKGIAHENFLEMSVDETLKKIKGDSSWFRSQASTPFFSAMTKALIKDQRFANFNNSYNWIDKLTASFHALSDFTHIKGYKKGSQSLNKPTLHVGSSSFHNVNEESLKDFADLLIETVQHLAVLVALYNPVTLVDLPLEEKFGLNEPIGFIHSGQSQMLHKIIPDEYKNYFEQLKTIDDEVTGIKEWVDAMPSLTEADIRIQIDQLHTMVKDNDKETVIK